MKNFSLKALGATFIAAALVVFGAAIPAHAAGALTVTATAVPSGSIGTTGTNALPISISFTPVTAGADTIEILLPTGWSPVNGSTLCANSTVASPQGSISCVFASGKVRLFRAGGVAFTTSAVIVFEFGNSTLNVAAARDFTVNTYAMLVSTTVPVDTGIGTLGGGSTPTPTPTPSPSSSTSSDTLASTGFDGAPYLAIGAVLAFTGIALMLFARRRQTS